MTKQIKKFMITIIAFLFVMFLSVTVNSEYAGAATAKGEVNADALNVRTGAGTNFDILSINGVQIRLVKGTKVTITEELPGDWYKVEFIYEGKKNTGYVAAMYVSPIVDKSILAEYLQIEAKLLKKMKISKKPSEKSGALTYKDKEFNTSIFSETNFEYNKLYPKLERLFLRKYFRVIYNYQMDSTRFNSYEDAKITKYENEIKEIMNMTWKEFSEINGDYVKKLKDEIDEKYKSISVK